MVVARTIDALLIACLVVLAACSSSTSPTPSSTSDTQQVGAGCISAMMQVNSYKLDTDVVNTYKIISGPNATTNITEWKGTKLVNISTQEMGMNMTITDVYFGSNSNASLEMYFKGGEEYLKTVATGLYQPNPWTKTQLTNTLWNRETQISYLTEILKTTTQLSSLASEKVNGVDCYILDIVPSTQAIIDWVISQEQPVGPQMDIMFGGAVSVVRADAYQSGSVKLWIDKGTFLILRANVNSVFSGNVGGGPITTIPYTPTTNPVNSSFDGQITFSEYHQPVSIQLPQEAISAQESEIQ